MAIFMRILIVLFLMMWSCSVFALTATSSYVVNQQVAAGSYQTFSTTISGIPNDALITKVNAKFDYIAYNGVQTYVSCRFKKNADPGPYYGAVLVAQGTLPAGNPGTYGYIGFNDWNNQGVNDTYYFCFIVAAGSPYAPTVKTIYVSVDYSVPLPPAPVLSTPSNLGAKFNQTPHSYTWSTAGNAVKYRIYVDNNSGFGSPEINQEPVSNSLSSNTVLANNVYYWKVQAANSQNQWGPWSSTYSYVEDTPPPAPSISNPANNAQMQADSSLALYWSGPSGYSINRYYLRIVQGTDFNASPKYAIELSSTSQTVSLAGWTPGTYTWSVRAIKNAPSGFNQTTYENAIGWGAYDTTRTFVIQSPPSPPSLVSPTNDLIRKNTSPYSFSWTAVSNAAKYRIYVDNHNGFGSPEINQDPLSTSYTYSTLLADNVYYWKVQACNSSGVNGSWSSVGRFLLDTPPSMPSLNVPASGTQLAQNSTVIFSWLAPANATIHRYHLKIVQGTDLNSGTTVFDAEILDTSKSLTLTGWNTGTYTWGVRAIKTTPLDFNQAAYETAIGWGSYGVRSFTVISDSGSGPNLSTPANSASINNSTIAFSWSSVTNATEYELMVDDKNDFTTPELSGANDPANATQRNLVNHLPNGTYYWKVRAKLNTGLYTTWSPVYSFTYTLPVADTPVWVPLYRLYKSSSHDHFYTTIPSHVESSLADGYVRENIEGYISDRKFNDANCGYIFRLRHKVNDVNLYTQDATEKENRIAQGFTYEGILGFTYMEIPTRMVATGGLVSLYRLYNSTLTDNFYTTSWFERTNAINVHQYVGTGNKTNAQGYQIIGYVSPDGRYLPDSYRKTNLSAIYGFNPGNGNFTHSPRTDFSISGIHIPLIFQRSYNSLNCKSDGPLGFGWAHSYQSYIVDDGKNIAVCWAGGAVDYYQRDGSTILKSLSVGCYDTLTITNNQYCVTKKDQSQYLFAGKDTTDINYPTIPLKEIKEKHGKSLKFSYSNLTTRVWTGKLEYIEDTVGRRFNFTYYTDPNQGPLNHIKEITDVAGRKVSFVYDITTHDLLSVTDARGYTTSYQYNSDHQMIRITYPEGNQLINTYSGINLTSQTLDGKLHNIEYANGLTKIYDPSSPSSNPIVCGIVGNQLQSVQNRLGNTVNLTYGTTNPTLPSTVKDPKNNTSSFVYDESSDNNVAVRQAGNIKEATNARGHKAYYTYDSKNNLLEFKDFRGNSTTFQWDANQMDMLRMINPENGVWQYTYYSDGLPNTITDPNSRTTYLTYTNGNLTNIKDALTTMSFGYDNLGRRTSYTDAKGRTTTYGYDNNDNVIKITAPNNEIVEFEYDKNNRLTKITNQRGKAYRFTYNSRNLLISQTDPEGKVHTYQYDDDNNLISSLAPDGNTTSFTYDTNHQILQKLYNGNLKASFGYDANGNPTSVTDVITGTISYNYNELNFAVSIVSPWNDTIAYEYDPNANISKITYPGNKSVNYTYDKDNNLKTVVDWLGGNSTYTYNLSGDLLSLIYPNNTRVNYTYDAVARLVGISNRKSDNTIIAEYNFILDSNGNHSQVTQTVPIAPQFTASNINAMYSDANRLTSDSQANYIYDNLGNLTSSSMGNTYIYDYLNRLATASIGGKNYQYEYDGLDNRISRTENSVKTKYILDRNSAMSQILAETDNAGSITNYYVYGHSLLYRIHASGQRSCYHFDSRGSTVAMTDSSQAITHKYAYDPYGKTLAKQEADPNPFQFVGQWGVMDEGNGLLFMRARYYDTAVKRFINQDPIGLQGGLNLYAYADGNPVMNIDPKGTFLGLLCIGVGIVAAYNGISLGYYNSQTAKYKRQSESAIHQTALIRANNGRATEEEWALLEKTGGFQSHAEYPYAMKQVQVDANAIKGIVVDQAINAVAPNYVKASYDIYTIYEGYEQEKKQK